MVGVRVRALAGLLVLAALAAACGSGSGAPRAKGSPSGPVLPDCRPHGILDPGDEIPGCSFERLDGGILSLAALRDRPLVINFWASWCAFCIKEMPAFQRTYERLAGRVEIVGMNTLDVQGETRSAALEFARRTGVSYPLAYDRRGLLYSNFALRTVMPMTIFVRAGGLIAFRRFGPLDERSLMRTIQDELGVGE